MTVEQVHRILAGERLPETREEDTALVRGYRDAMSFILRRADDTAFRWDRELVIGLNDRILAGNRAAAFEDLGVVAEPPRLGGHLDLDAIWTALFVFAATGCYTTNVLE